MGTSQLCLCCGLYPQMVKSKGAGVCSNTVCATVYNVICPLSVKSQRVFLSFENSCGLR